MPIGTTNAYSGPYLANGITVAFPFTFEVLSADQVSVFVRDSSGVETTIAPTEYFVTLAYTAPSPGTVTFNTAPATGNVYVLLDPAFSQQIEFADGSAWLAKPVNDGYDHGTLRDQVLRRDLDRTILAPLGESMAPLPGTSARAGKFLAFDAGGNPVAGSGGAGDSGLRSDLGASGGAALSGFLQAGTGAVARSVESKLRDTITPEDFGAVSNGITDDRAAIALADAAGAFVFTAGAYKIASNLTIANNVRFEPGASIIVPTGVTVTFSGYVDAWVAQIFQCSGTGKVVLNAVRNKVGFPEWWGAKANDSTGSVPANNVLAIHAALAALRIIDLQGSDYFINATIKILYPNRHLRGVSSLYDSVYGTGATRLLMTDGTTDILQVGPDANPGTIAQFIEGVKVTGIAVARTVAPVVASACSAIRAQFILESYFEDVRGDESMIGWTFNGVVHAIVNRCSAKRTSAGTGGTDSWKGFYALGASGVGAGGNASLYISYSHADDTRAVKTGGIGFYADGKFTDCFWIHCETVSSAVGMEVNGNSATSNDFGNTDMTIVHPVVDQFTVVGIYIHNMGASGSVSIIEPYCGPAPGATAAIYAFTNKGGAINVTGGQLVMGASTSAVGVIIEANGQKSGAVYINGTIISEATAGGVVLSDATNCRIMPIVQNDTITGGPAVKLNNACLANIIAPIVKGKASGSTYGIQVVGTTDARNEYNLSGIDSGTIAGGSGNKLVRNAVQIVATGLTGTNLASGVVT